MKTNESFNRWRRQHDLSREQALALIKISRGGRGGLPLGPSADEIGSEIVEVLTDRGLISEQFNGHYGIVAIGATFKGRDVANDLIGGQMADERRAFVALGGEVIR